MQKAKGIPDRDVYGDLEKIKPGDVLKLLVQEHLAERAGKHFDIRIDVPKYGLISWATRKGLPESPGEKRLLIEQPLHESEYAEFEGEIPSGYGKGTVKKLSETSILVTGVGPNFLKFSVISGKDPQRFVMVKSKDGKQWYVINVTPTEYPDYQKPRFKSIDAKEINTYLEKLREGDTIQEKIDGAHGIIELLRNTAEILSVRKRQSGGPIVHTERIFGKEPREFDIPKELQGSILSGEIFGVRDGKTIPPQELSAILNSVIERSLQKQEETNTKLRVALFDISKGKKDFSSLPYTERFKILRERILPHLPEDVFEVVQYEDDPEKAKEFWERIRSGQNPRTEEGVILRLQSEKKPIKIKLYDEMDVYIRRFFPGEGKYKDTGVGGFYYSLTPNGEIVGKVGTGFSDELRKLMKERPEEFIGRVARIKYQSQYPSKALRLPAFVSLHEGK